MLATRALYKRFECTGSMEQDLLKTKELVSRIRNLSFLLKESTKNSPQERNILNLVSYVTLLEEHVHKMHNRHSVEKIQEKKSNFRRPAFEASNFLANQKARELLD